MVLSFLSLRAQNGAWETAAAQPDWLWLSPHNDPWLQREADLLPKTLPVISLAVGFSDEPLGAVLLTQVNESVMKH